MEARNDRRGDLLVLAAIALTILARGSIFTRQAATVFRQTIRSRLSRKNRLEQAASGAGVARRYRQSHEREIHGSSSYPDRT